MFRSKLWQIATLVIVLSMVLVACAGDTEGTPEVVGGFEIPTVDEGKFNVAMVLIGPHDDGGWSEDIGMVSTMWPTMWTTLMSHLSSLCQKELTQSKSFAAWRVKVSI